MRSRAGKRHLLQTKNPKRRRSLGTVQAGRSHGCLSHFAEFTLQPLTNPPIFNYACHQFTRLPQAPHAHDQSRQGLSLASAPNCIATPPTRWITGCNTPIAIAKPKKRNFRALWQVRINAAARAAGITYSRFMEGLKAAKCALNRKMLADLAAQDAAAFAELVQMAKNALARPKPPKPR